MMSSQIVPPNKPKKLSRRPSEGHHVHNSYLDDSVSTRPVARITEPRLRRLVQKKSSLSTPGPDGIGYQIYKSHASSHHCYQSCIRRTNRSALLENRIIYKKGDAKDPTNFVYPTQHQSSSPHTSKNTSTTTCRRINSSHQLRKASETTSVNAWDINFSYQN
jgi:hypothetical protein